MLTEGFSVFDAEFQTAMSAPPFATVEVFVDAVLFEQPVSLTGVAGKHLLLQLGPHLARIQNKTDTLPTKR